MRSKETGRPAMVVALSLLLALVTAGIGAQTLRLLAAPSGVVEESTVDGGAAVTAFYTALNEAFAGDSTAGLERLIAPDFVDYLPAPGATPDRAGFLSHISALADAAPGTRLTIAEVTARGGQVVARVRVAAPLTTLGIPAPPDAIWGSMDVFRVREGLIVAHWGDERGGSSLVPLAAISFPYERPARLIVSLERHRFAAGTSEVLVGSAGPSLVVVADGALDAEPPASSSQAAIPFATIDGVTAHLALGRATRLRAGDVLTVPPGGSARLMGADQAPAEAYVVTLGLPAPGGPASGSQPSATWSPSVERTLLAGGRAAEVLAGTMTLAAGWVDLAPGASIGAHTAGGPELLAVTDGSLTVALSDGEAWLQHAGTGTIAAATGGLLGPGDGALVLPGPTVAYVNAAPTPARALVLTLRPVEPIPVAV